MESENLLIEHYETYAFSSVVEDIMEIINREKHKMMMPNKSERYLQPLPEGAIINGTWRSGWCSEQEMLENNMFYEQQL